MESIHNDSLVEGSSDEREPEKLRPEDVCLADDTPFYYLFLNNPDPHVTSTEERDTARTRASEVIANNPLAVLNCQGLDIESARASLGTLYQ